MDPRGRRWGDLPGSTRVWPGRSARIHTGAVKTQVRFGPGAGVRRRGFGSAGPRWCVSPVVPLLSLQLFLSGPPLPPSPVCGLGVGLDPLRCGVGGLPGSTWAVCLDPRGCGLNGRPASTRVRFRRPAWITTGAVWAVWIHAGAVWAVGLDPRGCGRAVGLHPRGCGLGGQPGSTEARLELKCGLGWSLEGVGGG